MNLCMEEFERMNPIPAGVIRCGNGYAATDWGWASRDYVNAFKAFSDGWKASRAALCVEFPDFSKHEDGGEWWAGYTCAVSDVKSGLNQIGVTCK